MEHAGSELPEVLLVGKTRKIGGLMQLDERFAASHWLI